jgi:glycosyltransferase involved in cell wall biosynthesis
MKETVDVIIPSFGHLPDWEPLAKRAIASVENQTRPPDSIQRLHLDFGSLSSVRNHGVHDSHSKWLCFLDCDDELEPEYLEKMLESGSDMELRYPTVRYINEMVDPPTSTLTVLQPKPLSQGNFMVCSTLVTRENFVKAGMFRHTVGWEDWDCWIRCYFLGCEPRHIPGAIIRVHQRPGSLINVADPQALVNEVREYNEQWRKDHIQITRWRK